MLSRALSVLLSSCLLWFGVACGGAGENTPPPCPDGIETPCGCCADDACVADCNGAETDGGAVTADGGSTVDGGSTADGGPRVDGGARDGGAAGCPCASGSYCDLATNTCVPGCLADGDCGASKICESRACVTGCRTDAACGQGRICQSQQCVSGCTDDASCGSGYACARPACVPKLESVASAGSYPRLGITSSGPQNVWITGKTNTTMNSTHHDGYRTKALPGFKLPETKTLFVHSPSELIAIGDNRYQACTLALRYVATRAGTLTCRDLSPPWSNEVMRAGWRKTDGSALWAVGTRGRISSYRFGVMLSLTETRETTPVILDLNAVWGTEDASELWAAGAGGVILRRSAAGSWTQVASPTTQDLLAIHGTAANNVWFVGVGGVVLRWNGSAFEEKNVANAARLNAVWCASASDCWVGGESSGNGGSFVRRWNGTAYETPRGAVSYPVNTIHGTSANDVWVGTGDLSTVNTGGLYRFHTSADPVAPTGETCGTAIPLSYGTDVAYGWDLGVRQDVPLPSSGCGNDARWTVTSDSVLRATVPAGETLELAYFPTALSGPEAGGLFAVEGDANVCSAPTACVANSVSSGLDDFGFLRYKNESGAEKTLHIVVTGGPTTPGNPGYVRYSRIGPDTSGLQLCDGLPSAVPMTTGFVDGTLGDSRCTLGGNNYGATGPAYRVSIPARHRLVARAAAGAPDLKLGIFDLNRTDSCTSGTTTCLGAVGTLPGRSVTYTRNGPAETVISVRAVAGQGNFHLFTWVEPIQ